MKTIHRLIIGLCLFFAALLLFGSCKSVQAVEKVNYRDSTILHHHYDTTHITLTDTIHVTASNESERESETEIVFGAGGGTYNAHTGEATNVAGVKQSSKEKELQQLVLNQVTTINRQSATIDSLNATIKQLKKESEEKQNTSDIKPQRNGWDRFCTWYVIISWILVALCVAWWAFKRFHLHR